MKASVSGRVRNTNLPKSKPLLPLFEAIINGIQAIEDAGGGRNSRIFIQAERERSLDLNTLSRFENFTITDTGIGFTDPNYESFQTADSTYKVERGGKGLGRFAWLKAFKRVEIESYYRSGDEIFHRSFSFMAKDNTITPLVAPSSNKSTGTTVRLIGFQAPYAEAAPIHLEVVAQKIIGHFLPFFLNPDCPTIIIRDENDEIDIHNLFRDTFHGFASEHNFTIHDQVFKLKGFRLHGALANQSELVYVADFREVITERISKYMPNLRSRLPDPDHGDFHYLAIVQGKFLDENVNSGRTDFSIPREHAGSEHHEIYSNQIIQSNMSIFVDEISLKSICENALSLIGEDLQPFISEINSQKEDALVNYIEHEAPQYRVLLRYKEEFIDQIPPQSSKTDLEMALHRQLYNRQVSLKQESHRILTEAEAAEEPEDYFSRFKNFMERFNEIGKTALAQHVVHRRVIIDLLEKALNKNPETGRYALEKTVHRLVFPMSTSSDDVPFEQQNLWMIDERLTYHSFLTSNQQIRSADAIESTSENRPDILLFNRPLAFASEDDLPLTSIVVIEFKRPDRRNYREEDPVTQVYRMVRDIRKGHYKDKRGREIRALNENIPAYCYIICDITEQLEITLVNMSAFKTPDNLGYYGFNPSLNAYYEVISYQKLLTDARKRNRILFEKLNLPQNSRM